MNPDTPTGSFYAPGTQPYGHPSTWAPQPQPPERKRRSRWPLVLVVIAVLIAAAAGAAVAYTATRKTAIAANSSKVPSAPVGGSPTEAPAQLDERATCGALIPLMTTTADLVLAYAKKQPWDKATAQHTQDQLIALYKVAPADMQSDISYQASALSAMLSGNGYTREQLVDSGTRLANRCRKYATG